MIELPESFNLAKQIFGEPGGYQVVMCARNKEKPCPNCSSLIQKESYTGGAVFILAQPASHPNEKFLDRLNKKHLQFAGT